VQIPTYLANDQAVLPSYAQEGDAGADLRASQACTIAANGGRALVSTGVHLAIPQGYAGFVQPRSGLALRHGVTCLNTPGLIDSGYRGEIKVILINHDPVEDFTIEVGDRIAQLVIQQVETANFFVVDESQLGETERGEGGFGSTGKI
jgi:dUTP pyrophosphatase